MDTSQDRERDVTRRDQGVRELEEPHADTCKGTGFQSWTLSTDLGIWLPALQEGMGARREVPSQEALPLPAALPLRPPPPYSPLFPSAPPTQPPASPAPQLPQTHPHLRPHPKESPLPPALAAPSGSPTPPQFRFRQSPRSPPVLGPSPLSLVRKSLAWFPFSPPLQVPQARAWVSIPRSPNP